MPSPDIIKEKLTQLPILDNWTKPSRRMFERGSKVWESTEKGGHFHFYGHDGYLWDPETGDNIFALGYTLSITGSDQSKEAIISDFTEVLGEPRHDYRIKILHNMSKRRRKITFLTWLQPAEDYIENKPSYGLLARTIMEAFLMDCTPREEIRHKYLGTGNILPPR